MMDALPENPGILVDLPSDLQYLIAPVLDCRCRGEGDIFAYLDRATPEDMNRLATVAARVLENDHYPSVLKFLNQFEMTDFDECAQLYFFFGLLDYAGLKFDRVPEAK